MPFRVLLLALLAGASCAQTVDPDLYAGLKWRLIGPFRGGKSTMVSGVPGNPAIYYMATAGSGVWKTVDGGQVWTCVSDSMRLTSVGAVAVAPSRPRDGVRGRAGSGPERDSTGRTTAEGTGIWSRSQGPRGQLHRDRSAQSGHGAGRGGRQAA